MKLTYFVIVCLIAFFSCQRSTLEPVSSTTDPMFVTLDKATNVALNISKSSVLRQKSAQNARAGITVKVSTSSIVLDDGQPAFYIFNYEGGGFSIVSADRRMQPIIAYSDKGQYTQEQKPGGVSRWENITKDIVKDLRSSTTTESQYDGEWSTMDCVPDPDGGCHDPNEVLYYASVGPLLFTNWDQGCGYNTYCPTVSSGGCGGRAWTGCVATSMAQIMRYYQYPTSYSWSSMPNNSGNSDVASLMYAAGDAVDMNWGGDGSGASTGDVDDALTGTFGYQSANYSSFNQVTVKNELSYNRLVMLDGCDSQSTVFGVPYRYSSCHAWVCDGYQETQYTTYGTLYLHMNWGWSSDYNGWYAYNDWTIHLSGGGTRNYQYSQGMVYNIRKP